jgi:hypothetical protein
MTRALTPTLTLTLTLTLTFARTAAYEQWRENGGKSLLPRNNTSNNMYIPVIVCTYFYHTCPYFCKSWYKKGPIYISTCHKCTYFYEICTYFYYTFVLRTYFYNKYLNVNLFL